MKHFYRYILYCLLLLVGLQLIGVSFVGFPNFVIWEMEQIGLSNKSDLLLPILQRIPIYVIILSLLLLLTCLILALYWQTKILSRLNEFVRYWKEAFVNLVLSLKGWEIWLIMLLPFCASIYFASDIAVSYDEAITYNLFTSKPFFYCQIFYPYPNNHVLHSLITNLTEYTPFVGTLFGIRLPVILVSLFTCLIAYSFLKKFYNSSVSLLVVGLASAMYLTIYYSFMSRGYAFMVLCFVVCLYAAYNIVRHGNRNKDWMFFVVAGILGCYTIPSFLYPFATVNVLILIYNLKNIKKQIIANCIAGISVILLYAPIMFVDGIDALANNQFVEQISRTDILAGIFDFYRGMFVTIVGLPNYMSLPIIVLLIISLIAIVYQKDKWHLSVWLVFMLAPFVLLILHAVHPFYRTFLYYNFILIFLIVIPFRSYIGKTPKFLLLPFILTVQILGVYSFNSQIREREGFNTYAKIVADTYFKPENTILFPCIASANYEFEAKVLGLEGQIHFQNQVAVDVDTIAARGYVIVADHRDKTVNKKPYDIIGQQHIYKNE